MPPACSGPLVWQDSGCTTGFWGASTSLPCCPRLCASVFDCECLCVRRVSGLSLCVCESLSLYICVCLSVCVYVCLCECRMQGWGLACR